MFENDVRVIRANIKKLTDFAGWTQRDLATATGIAQSGLSQKMRGSTDWTLRDLSRISTALSVSVSELTGQTPELAEWDRRRAPRATQVDTGLRYLVMPEDYDDGLLYRSGALSRDRLTPLWLIGDLFSSC